MAAEPKSDDVPATVYKRWTPTDWTNHVVKEWSRELTRGRQLSLPEDQTLRHLIEHAIKGALYQAKDPAFTD